MFTHLLQTLSFKSTPRNFTTSIWGVLVLGLLFTGVQGYALGLSPGNDPIRMFAAAALKISTISLLMYLWMRSVDAGAHFNSTILVIIFVSLITELVKLPLSTMIRQTEQDQDVVMAIVYSIPLWATVVWQYWVWYYSVQAATVGSKVEIIVVMLISVLMSETTGSVLSQIGAPVEGFV